MELIYLKDIDKSLLYQGFTIRTALLNQFIDFFGKLAIGETRKISIMWDNQLFTDIDVINQNFNRERYPNHPEMYQVRYSPNHPFAKAMRLAFPELTQYLEQQQTLRKGLTQQGIKTHNIRIPDDLRGSIVFYATTNKDIWEAVPIPAQEINQAKQELIAHPIEESLLESLLLNDETAQIIERPHLARIRRIDKNVCLNLKKLYGYRCQICGQLITLPYGGQYHVIDAHHIDPFSTSLNNNFSNIVILCPNHHRIIHAYNPHFTPRTKEFVYANGYRDKLSLNLHL